MRKILLFLLLAVVNIPLLAKQKPLCDFGLGADEDFETEWYSGQLAALGESCLNPLPSAPTLPTYRFLWLRSFLHPISVRLQIQKDGSGVIVRKETDGHNTVGSHGMTFGKPIKNSSLRVSKRDVDEFLRELATAGFWEDPFPMHVGDDGANWVMEVRDGTRYRTQEKWTPQKGDPFRAACLRLLTLSGFDLKAERIY